MASENLMNMHTLVRLDRSELRLVIADLSTDHAHFETDERRALPGNVKQKLLRPSDIDELYRQADELIEIARLSSIPAWKIIAYATTSYKTYLNSRMVLARAEQVLGLRFHQVSPSQEALHLWYGATHDLSIPTGSTLVLYLEPAQTQLVQCSNGELQYSISLPTSVHSLAEYLSTETAYSPSALNNCRAQIKRTLARVQLPERPKRLVVFGSGVNGLAGLIMSQTTPQVGAAHGIRVNRATLRRWNDRLLSTATADKAEIRLSAALPRQPIIAGNLLIEACCTLAYKDSVQLSAGDEMLGRLMLRAH